MNRKIISSAENEQEELFDWFYQQLTTTFQDETVRELFLLAFVEAVKNAAIHGNGRDLAKKIVIEYLLGKEYAWVSVEDEGAGYEPVFPDLKTLIVKAENLTSDSGGGMGLGFIKSNTDAVFFNRKGNKIIFIKGGRVMQTLASINTTLTVFPDGTALATDMRVKGAGHFKLRDGISEIFDFCDKKVGSFYFDLQNIKILDSQVWGLIFAEAEREEIKLIRLFNARKAIQTSAEQLGIGKRQGSYSKIKISADDKEVQQLLGKL